MATTTATSPNTNTLEKQPHALDADFEDPHIVALRDNPEVREKLTWTVVLSVFFLSLGLVAPVSLGFILPTAILVQIGTDLGDTLNIGWVASGWSVGTSIGFGIGGSLSDIFGRRPIILLGQLIVLVGCIVAATATSLTSVIVGSTIIGYGCGTAFVSFPGISEILPNKWRGLGLAAAEAALVIPWGFAGVYIAYQFLERSWRWVYYAAIIYTAVAIIGTAIVYFPPTHPQHDYGKTRFQQVKELDFVGIFLFSSGLTVFLVGLSWAGQPQHPWRSVSVIAPIILGFLTFAACFVYDFTVRPKNAFLPLELFRNVRGFTLLLVLVAVSGMIFFSASTLLPQATLYCFTNDSTEIGVISLPSGAGQLIGGVILPALVHKIKRIRGQFVTAMLIQTIFCALYAVALTGQHKYAWMMFQLFGQGAFGWITILCYVTASVNVPQAQLGVALGLIGVFRSAGGSVGIAIFTTIFSGLAADKVAPAIAAAGLSNGLDPANVGPLVAATINNAVGVPGSFAAVPGITDTISSAAAQALKDAYSSAFSITFLTTIAFNVIALICAFFVMDISPFLTNHTAVHLEKEVVGDKHVGEKHAGNDSVESADPK